MLIEFYGKECPHCLKIAPLVEDLKKEPGVKIEQYEVWHSAENLKKMEEYDNGLCGGVPFLFNTETKKFICGEASFEELKSWAGGAMKEPVKSLTHSPAKSELDFSYITDGIYIGTNECCQIHFDKELKEAGIEADISLEENRVDAPFGVGFYLWLPVKDRTAPTKEQLEVGVSALEKLVSLNKKAYVHCKNGHGRATTLVAAYLIKKGMKAKEALEFIKGKRPSVHLQEAQMKVLEDLETNKIQ
jgi:thiol-disulfide isomerase/thioredoxin